MDPGNVTSMGDSDELLDESDEPTDYYSSDSASESGLDTNLDSDVDQICKKPDWDAMGIPEPSLEEWIRMSKKPYSPELPKKDKEKVRAWRSKAAWSAAQNLDGPVDSDETLTVQFIGKANN